MVRDAVDGRAFGAHLRPSRAAVRANPTAEVVVDHNSGANLREARINSRPDLVDNTTRFVARDCGSRTSKTQCILRAYCAVDMQVRTAHTRGLHCHDYFARARRGVGEVLHFQFPVAEKDYAFHDLCSHRPTDTMRARNANCNGMRRTIQESRRVGYAYLFLELGQTKVMGRAAFAVRP